MSGAIGTVASVRVAVNETRCGTSKRTSAFALTASEWWETARQQWRATPPARQWRDVLTYSKLSDEDQERISKRAKRGLTHTDPAVRYLCWKISEDIYVATAD